MSTTEKIIFIAGMAVAFFYPTLFLFLQKHWVLGIVHVLLVIGFFATLYQFYCSKCMNFACPLNNVSSEKRELFFSKNPAVQSAWMKIKD